jgi:hypothetical protein
MQKQLGIQIVPQDGDVKYLVIDSIAQPSNLTSPPQAITIALTVFDRYVGYYKFPGLSVMTISRDGDRFLAQLPGQSPIQIFPTSERTFFAKVVDATITFATSDHGAATALVLHQNGRDISAPRMSEAVAKAQLDELARRVREQKAAPGSEAALRKHIEAVQRDQPDYDDMDSALAAAIRTQWAAAHQQFTSFGRLQAIKFTGVGPGGGDIYQVQFEKGTAEMRISLDSAGKITGLLFRRMPAP